MGSKKFGKSQCTQAPGGDSREGYGIYNHNTTVTKRIYQ